MDINLANWKQRYLHTYVKPVISCFLFFATEHAPLLRQIDFTACNQSIYVSIKRRGFNTGGIGATKDGEIVEEERRREIIHYRDRSLVAKKKKKRRL